MLTRVAEDMNYVICKWGRDLKEAADSLIGLQKYKEHTHTHKHT